MAWLGGDGGHLVMCHDLLAVVMSEIKDGGWTSRLKDGSFWGGAESFWAVSYAPPHL